MNRAAASISQMWRPCQSDRNPTIGLTRMPVIVDTETISPSNVAGPECSRKQRQNRRLSHLIGGAHDGIRGKDTRERAAQQGVERGHQPVFGRR